MTIDLTNSRTLPTRVHIDAYAVCRDVEVLVRPGTRVEMSGRADNDHLHCTVADVAPADPDHSLRISGHTFLGDVTVRAVDPQP